MPNIEGLRSPYDKVGRLVYFGRMLDKIRLHAAGRLPADYAANLGESNPRFFDARCCRFLGIRYAELVARTAQGEAATDWSMLDGGHVALVLDGTRLGLVGAKADLGLALAHGGTFTVGGVSSH